MDDPCFYGFPTFGEAGPKAAQDAGGKATTADTRDFEVEPENLRGVEEFLSSYIPGALGPIIYTKTCLYTLTPDRDFVIDTVPGHENVVVAIGAGHAFKFASQIGRLLSELALTGKSTIDLTPFALDRPLLTMKDPPRTTCSDGDRRGAREAERRSRISSARWASAISSSSISSRDSVSAGSRRLRRRVRAPSSSGFSVRARVLPADDVHGARAFVALSRGGRVVRVDAAGVRRIPRISLGILLLVVEPSVFPGALLFHGGERALHVRPSLRLRCRAASRISSSSR